MATGRHRAGWCTPAHHPVVAWDHHHAGWWPWATTQWWPGSTTGWGGGRNPPPQGHHRVRWWLPGATIPQLVQVCFICPEHGIDLVLLGAGFTALLEAVSACECDTLTVSTHAALNVFFALATSIYLTTKGIAAPA